MIEDFVDDSAPIINTDYRFGGMLKIQRGFSKQRWLGLRLFFGHESTHLGDEFSLAGEQAFPDSFERIDVSWEFVDFGILFEAIADPIWSVQAGFTHIIGTSYYNVDASSATKSAAGTVTPSTNQMDPYIGFDLEREFRNKVGAYMSVEGRWRSVYDYHKPNPESAEKRQLSVNLVIGVRKSGSGDAIGRASPFVRVYYGVNPHGQFRNQNDYTEFGIGLRLVH